MEKQKQQPLQQKQLKIRLIIGLKYLKQFYKVGAELVKNKIIIGLKYFR